MIVVVDHDPGCSWVFESLRDRYRRVLTGVPVVGIEHGSSTSVPGRASKPDIDVDIVVAGEHVPDAIRAGQSDERMNV